MFDTFINLGINTILIVGGWYVAWHWQIKHMPFLRKLLDLDVIITKSKSPESNPESNPEKNPEKNPENNAEMEIEPSNKDKKVD